jgi:hypothetical protein
MKFFTLLAFFIAGAGLFLVSGCYYNGKGIPYVALTCPEDPIETPSAGKQMLLERRRAGFYFLNQNFRPAPDVAVYLEQAHQRANTPVLRNADIRLSTPIVVFPVAGPQFQAADGPDLISVNKQ